MGRRLTRVGLLYLGMVYCFLFFPPILVIIFSFNRSHFWAFPLKGFTFQWYQELTVRTDAVEAAMNSLIVAGPTMVFAVIVGSAVSIAIYRWRVAFKGVAEGTILLPMIIPHLIWAIALLLFLTALNTQMGPATVILGHVLLTTPFVVLLMNARLHSFDPNLEDAARGLGAGPGRIFYRIVLPHLAPALISGGVIAFAISFSELVVAYFLTGGGFNTLPVFIYSLIQLEPSPIINVLASIIFGVGMVALLIALIIGGRDVLLVGKGKMDAG